MGYAKFSLLMLGYSQCLWKSVRSVDNRFLWVNKAIAELFDRTSWEGGFPFWEASPTVGLGLRSVAEGGVMTDGR
jgi:hypothetical protein